MLAIIAGVIILLWLLGFTVWHVGGLIHLLLIVAIILVIFHFMRGRNTV